MDKLVTEYIWLLRQPEASIKFSHQSRYFFNSKHQSNSRAGLEINQCEQVLARKFSQADSPATFPPPQPHAPPPEINPFRKLQGTSVGRWQGIGLVRGTPLEHPSHNTPSGSV